MFDLYGQFVSPEKRGGYITIFRGCFVLDMLMVSIVSSLNKYMCK